MAKIKLDLDPQGPITFDRAVSIPTPSGKPLKVTFTFKHRTRAEMAELSERYTASAREKYAKAQATLIAEKKAFAAAEAAGEVYLPQIRDAAAEFANETREDVEAVLETAVGWDLDQEFSADNLAKFFNLYAGAALAIATDYKVSMKEGRLGN